MVHWPKTCPSVATFTSAKCLGLKSVWWGIPISLFTWTIHKRIQSSNASTCYDKLFWHAQRASRRRRSCTSCLSLVLLCCSFILDLKSVWGFEGLIDWLISPVLKLNAVVAARLQIFLRRSSTSCAPDISFFSSLDFCVYLCPSFFFLHIERDVHHVHQAVGYAGDRIVSVHVQLTFCIDNRFCLFVACWKVIICCRGGKSVTLTWEQTCAVRMISPQPGRCDRNECVYGRRSE